MGTVLGIIALMTALGWLIDKLAFGGAVNEFGSAVSSNMRHMASDMMDASGISWAQAGCVVVGILFAVAAAFTIVLADMVF